MVNRKSGKYSVILDDLKEKIQQGHYPAGKKIPTVRSLSKAYGVCVNTACRAIKELEQENFVKIMPGSQGVYCRDKIDRRRSDRGDTVLLALEKNFFSTRKYHGDLSVQNMIASMQEELGKHGYKTIFHCLEDDCHEKQFMALAQGDKIAGAIITGSISMEALRSTQTLPIVKVVFNCIEAPDNIINLTPDYRGMVRETLKIFKKKQFQKICIYPSPENSHLTSTTILAYFHKTFDMLMPLYGFSRESIITINEVYPKSENDSPEKFGLPLKKDDSWKPLGIFTISPTYAKQLLDAIKKTDLIFGKDIGLVGIGNYRMPDGDFEKFSAWDTDPEKRGELAADELMECHKNPDIPQREIRFQCKYINRGTC